MSDFVVRQFVFVGAYGHELGLFCVLWNYLEYHFVFNSDYYLKVLSVITH